MMHIEGFIRSKDVYANRETIQKLGQGAYISLRPTSEIGDHTASDLLTDAEDFRIEYGRAEGPAFTMAECRTAEDAIETMIAIKATYPHLRIWYNGLEAQAEIIGDAWVGIAEILQETWEEWEVVTKVASGNLAPDDPQVLEAIDEVPLIAAAVAHVTP